MRLGPEATAIAEKLEELDRLVSAKRFEEVKRRLTEARERMRADGHGHAWVSFMLVDYFAYVGEWQKAFEMIEEALDQDPLSPPFHSELGTLTRRARKAFLDPGRDPADPSTPALYDLLVRYDGATAEVHLAMAHWRLGQGNAAGAHELAAAVTVLSPMFAEGWRCRGEAARRLGAEDEAAACDFEVRALGSNPAPPWFAIPGEGRA